MKQEMQNIMLNASKEISYDKNSSPPCATVIQRGITPKDPSKDRVNSGMIIFAILPASAKKLV